MKIDLHSHTHYSDGKLSVAELLMRAEQMQVDVLAITDHDTVAGIAPALEFVSANKQGLQLIPGVEISTKWHGFEIHILGLNINHECQQLQARLATQIVKRQQRAYKMCEKLTNIGIEGVYEQAQSLLKDAHSGACISRAHIAQVLMQRNICPSFQHAFTHYLGKDKKAYVNPQWISIEESIEWIHEAGGQAVIAHPFHYDMTSKWLRRLAKEFADLGGDGMEVQHPNLAKAKQALMLEIAIEAKLCGSSGSDFHAPSKWTELGRRLDFSEKLNPIWHRFDPPIQL